jgi:hypothetical protein
MSNKSQKRGSGRKEMRLAAVEREERRRRLLISLLAVGSLVILGGLLAYVLLQPSIEGVSELSGVVRDHDVEAKFPSGGLPPVGGVHPPSWQTCAVYGAPVDTGLAVHSLEHGAVWISYHPDLPASDVTRLAAHAAGDNWVLVSPYPDQSAPVVLTAWSVQLALDSATDERIPQFIERYKAQGPEPGVTCLNGVDTPAG